MAFWDLFTVVATLMGLFFFTAGGLGLLRFPDVFSRLHALTKADNLGLGLISIGLIPQVASVFDVLQLVITWVFVMIAGAVCSFLIANCALTTCHGDQNSTNSDQQQEDNNRKQKGNKNGH